MNGPYLQVCAVRDVRAPGDRRVALWKIWQAVHRHMRWTSGREHGPAIIYQDGSQWWGQP